MEGDADRDDCLRAFGLSLSFRGSAPPGAWEMRSRTEPGLQLRIDTPETVAGSWSGRLAIGWEAVIDGASFVVERGRAGDHRFVHRERAEHHLSADATLLRCAPRCEDGPRWWRVVLDSVLFSVALITGFEALHAGAVATPAGAIAVTAGAGAGKSTLVAELVRRGIPLLSDDVVVLEPKRKGPPLAHPGAPLMTVPARLSEGLGSVISSLGDEDWVAVPVHAEPVPLAALVQLDRRPAASTSLQRIRAPFGLLMESLLRFPQLPERERARFELASVLASSTAFWRLSADPEVDPASLASVLLADLAELTRCI
jgi:hypothetical protein